MTATFGARCLLRVLGVCIGAILVGCQPETRVGIEPVTVTVEQRQASAQLLRCGYIRREIAPTIYAPAFVSLLAASVVRDEPVSREAVREAVAAWNAQVVRPSSAITLEPDHFDKMASLAERPHSDCGLRGTCLLDAADLAVLRRWLNLQLPAPVRRAAPAAPSAAELACMNIDDDQAVRKALLTIAQDPVGRRLVTHAARRGATVCARSLRGPSAYCDCVDEPAIVVDPTVASYIFKLNCLVHELVHTVNPTDDNSVTEEALAEIIAMQVQDRITGVSLSCHPYVVFVDRLLDSSYGRLPINNDIEAHLSQVGIKLGAGSQWY